MSLLKQSQIDEVKHKAWVWINLLRSFGEGKASFYLTPNVHKEIYSSYEGPITEKALFNQPLSIRSQVFDIWQVVYTDCVRYNTLVGLNTSIYLVFRELGAAKVFSCSTVLLSKSTQLSEINFGAVTLKHSHSVLVIEKVHKPMWASDSYFQFNVFIAQNSCLRHNFVQGALLSGTYDFITSAYIKWSGVFNFKEMKFRDKPRRLWCEKLLLFSGVLYCSVTQKRDPLVFSSYRTTVVVSSSLIRRRENIHHQALLPRVFYTHLLCFYNTLEMSGKHM